MTASAAVLQPSFFRSRKAWAALAALIVIAGITWWLLRPAPAAREGVNPWAGPVPVRTVDVRRETSCCA